MPGYTTLSRRKLEADAAIAAHAVKCALFKSTAIPIGEQTTIADLTADLIPMTHQVISLSTDIASSRIRYHPTDATFAATGTEQGPAVGAVYYYDAGGGQIIGHLPFTSSVSTVDGIIVTAGADGIVQSQIAS